MTDTPDNVITLRNIALTDISGMLRQTADDFEAGKHGDADRVYLVIPAVDDYPKVFGFSADNGDAAAIVFELELAKLFLLQMVTKR